MRRLEQTVEIYAEPEDEPVELEKFFDLIDEKFSEFDRFPGAKQEEIEALQEEVNHAGKRMCEFLRQYGVTDENIHLLFQALKDKNRPLIAGIWRTLQPKERFPSGIFDWLVTLQTRLDELYEVWKEARQKQKTRT